ncbi:MAG: nucleoside triphosphate pyrophosphohydrolase [Clostridiales bacterium]|nr:nucleoside triphosphate pyrophosphohydrolase [Clostridiales bacterium]
MSEVKKEAALQTEGAANPFGLTAEEYVKLFRKAESKGEALERLDIVLRALRSENGCPWDRAQTHQSLRKDLIEEAYEADEALLNNDMDNLEEELGDVLLQVVFHSNLGSEEGAFDFVSVANRECEKMISRHTHVFGETAANGENSMKSATNFAQTIDKVLQNWDNAKQKEKGETRSQSMERIPKALPALRRSYKVQAKAAKVGFDWDRVEDAFAKVKEETLELSEVYLGTDKQRTMEELGDLLFAVVNVARFLEIDPEDALHFASRKFIDRFSYVEKSAAAAGKRLEDMTLEAMDKLWDEAKALETQKR